MNVFNCLKCGGTHFGSYACPFTAEDILKMTNVFEGTPDARQSDSPTLQLLNEAIHLLTLKDGDRDHMNSSALTVEQSMDICALLRDVRHQLYPEELT
jgi:hypothetical protein